MIDYLTGVAYAHHVSPLLFISIYAVSTVPFLLISGWLVHHIRRKRPLSLLFVLWGLCYSAPYIYLVAVGRNLAWWTYVIVAIVILAGLGLAGRGLKRRLESENS